MKLGVFFPASLFSAWSCSYGLVNTLRRMGHEVTSYPIDPQGSPIARAGQWFMQDGVIISGPEHIGKLIPPKTRIPAVAWMHETVEREDYGKLDVDAIKRNADIVFCPGIQDEKYGFRYLPFGVDTEVFKPRTICNCGGEPCYPALCGKAIDTAFIGLLYPKRQKFLAELKQHGVNLTTGNVQVLELGGVNPQKTAELYAENIRKIKVFVNLPTLSQLAVTKIYEVAACGIPIVTPKVSDMRNLEGLPAVFYENARDVQGAIQSVNETLVTASPAIISDIMYKNHRLELRCEKLIAALKEAA